jgi:hypothetical protein
VSKSSLTSPDADTPIRRPADTLPSAAHFERNHMPATYETMHYNESKLRNLGLRDAKRGRFG